MLLSGIYYGGHQIVRAYKNKEIIWQLGSDLDMFVANYIMSKGTAMITNAAMELIQAECAVTFGEPTTLNGADSVVASSPLWWRIDALDTRVSAPNSNVAIPISNINTSAPSDGVVSPSMSTHTDLYVLLSIKQNMKAQDSVPALVLLPILINGTPKLQSAGSRAGDVDERLEVQSCPQGRTSDSAIGNTEMDSSILLDLDLVSRPSLVGNTDMDIELGLDTAVDASDSCASDIEVAISIDQMPFVQSSDSVPGDAETEICLVRQMTTYANQSNTGRIDTKIKMDDAFNAALSDSIPGVADNEVCLIEQTAAYSNRVIVGQIDENTKMDGELNAASAATRGSVVNNAMLLDNITSIKSPDSASGNVSNDICLIEQTTAHVNRSAIERIDTKIKMDERLNAILADAHVSIVDEMASFNDVADAQLVGSCPKNIDSEFCFIDQMAAHSSQANVEETSANIQTSGESSVVSSGACVSSSDNVTLIDNIVNAQSSPSASSNVETEICAECAKGLTQLAPAQVSAAYTSVDTLTTAESHSSASAIADVQNEDELCVTAELNSTNTKNNTINIVEVIKEQVDLSAEMGMPALVEDNVQLKGGAPAQEAASKEHLIDAWQYVCGKLQQSLNSSKQTYVNETVENIGHQHMIATEIYDTFIQTLLNSDEVAKLNASTPILYNLNDTIWSEVLVFLQQLPIQELKGILSILFSGEATLTAHKSLDGFISDVYLQSQNHAVLIALPDDFLKILADMVMQDNAVMSLKQSDSMNIEELVSYASNMIMRNSKVVGNTIVIAQRDTVCGIANLAKYMCQAIAVDADSMATNVSFRCSANLTVVAKSDLEWEWPIPRDTDLFITQAFRIYTTDNVTKITLL